MSKPPIFSVTDHHVEDPKDPPPQVDDMAPGIYRGYFENEYGEQAIFLYDSATGTGTIRMGDAGWRNVYAVVDGRTPDLILNPNEALWLAACWAAVTAR
jgi:hypothetical protein